MHKNVFKGVSLFKTVSILTHSTVQYRMKMSHFQFTSWNLNRFGNESLEVELEFDLEF